MGIADGRVARFHLPLISDPGTSMTVWELDGTTTTTHLQPGVMYYHDARKPHEVHNASGKPRIQLCIDIFADAKLRAAIAEAAAAQ